LISQMKTLSAKKGSRFYVHKYTHAILMLPARGQTQL
jgi:pyruvate formate-lyase activating enzyme-like uncharacterized protein